MYSPPNLYQTIRTYYQKATEALPQSERRNMIPSQIMKNIYYHLLKLLEKKNFNVFHQKVEIPTFVQMSIAVKTLITEAVLSI